MEKFWYLSLCALVAIAGSLGWGIPISIAVIANGIIVLIDVIKTLIALVGKKKN